MVVLDEIALVVELLVVQVGILEYAPALGVEVAELRLELHPALLQILGCEGGVSVRGDVPVVGDFELEAVVVRASEARREKP